MCAMKKTVYFALVCLILNLPIIISQKTELLNFFNTVKNSSEPITFIFDYTFILACIILCL